MSRVASVFAPTALTSASDRDDPAVAILAKRTEELGTVHDQLDDLRCRLARDRADDREQGLDAETVAAIEDGEAHGHPCLVAASRAASAPSYCRVAWPIAPQTTISKTLSSLRPDASAAATSASVTLWARLVTLSISDLSGSASPALSNAARRSACDALPLPSRIRVTNALRAWLMSDMRSPA